MKKFNTGIVAVVLCLTITLVGCSVDQILSDIDVAIQIAASLAPAVGNVSPADGAIITVFSTLASGGLKDIQSAYDAWRKSGSSTDLQKAQSVIAEVRSNLSHELQTAHITDPKAVAAVTNWCNLLYSSLTAVEVALPQTGQGISAHASTAVIPTPESLQARWSAEVCSGEAKCSKLVKVHHVHAKTHQGFWNSVGTGMGEAFGHR